MSTVTNIVNPNAQRLLAAITPTPATTLKAIQETLDKETAPLRTENESLKTEINALQVENAALQSKLNSALKEAANLRAALTAAQAVNPPTVPEPAAEIEKPADA